jgi:RNA polymerase sigma-B factor
MTVEIQRSPTPRRSRAAAHRHAVSSARPDSDDRLFELYLEHGDLRAREELVRRFLPLAQRLARRYRLGNEPLEDLVQVAALALVKAVDRYDRTRGCRFISYAMPTIVGELKKYMRDSTWALHVPRGMKDRVLTVSDAVRKLSTQLGRSPTPEQVAAAVELPVEQVLEAMEAGAAYETGSLNGPLSFEDGADITLADAIGEPDAGFEMIEAASGLRRRMLALPERERNIVYLRFGEELTQTEIARRIGISQMHVSRLLRRALDRLHPLTEAAG